MRCLIAILLITFGVATARAEDATATVPGYAVTYFDLLRLAVPGMTIEEGTAVSPSVPDQRHVVPDYYNGEPPNPIEIASVAELRLISEGRTRLLLLAEAGPEAGMAGNQALLFAYEDRDGVLVFLDYADVGMGDYFAFVDTVAIGAHDMAVAIFQRPSQRAAGLCLDQRRFPQGWPDHSDRRDLHLLDARLHH